MKIGTNKLFGIYLAIVSFVSIIAVAITLGVVLTSVGKYYIISDEEYLQYRESYKLDNCKNPTYPASTKVGTTTVISNPVSPTEEEITKCEQKVRSEIHLSRAYDLKEMFITSFAWFIVFLILFCFHYPKFLKIKKEEE
ncbi:MAG: hypothetical protein PHE25_04150 [Candidatus Gracilibacteria bacterium]|nr:hypothetical protein [Candidatus Gracilibacteria bacterium]